MANVTYKGLIGCLLLLLPCLYSTANDSIAVNMDQNATHEHMTKYHGRPLIFDSIQSVADTCAPMVIIRQDQRIEDMIQGKIHGRQERCTTHIQGYRVQVFSSNTQKTAKSEAFKVEKKVKQDYTDIDIYVLYQPPFWKVRLGNFRTQEEAGILRDDLLKTYPNMQGDIYIVKDMIQVAEN